MYVQRNRGRTDIFFAQNACQSDRCLSRRSIWPSTPWMCPLIRPLKLQVGLRQHAHSRFWMVLRGSGKSVSYQRNSSGANSCHCFSGCLFFVLNASFALLCKLKLFWDQKSRMPLASFGEAGRLRDDFSVITRAFLRGGRFRQNDAAGKSEVVGTFPQDLSGETNFEDFMTALAVSCRLHLGSHRIRCRTLTASLQPTIRHSLVRC